WRSGPDDAPPQWEPRIYAGQDQKPCLDEPFSILARAALEFGESFLSLDIAETGIRSLKLRPDAQQPAVVTALCQLGHCKALALLRTGATRAAHQLLKELYTRNRDDIEVVAALARTYKDLAFLSGDGQPNTPDLERSHELYAAAFEINADFFPG